MDQPKSRKGTRGNRHECERATPAARGRGPESFGVGALNVGEVAQESEEDGFDEVPIFGATGEEGSELEDAPLKAIDIDDAEITTA